MIWKGIVGKKSLESNPIINAEDVRSIGNCFASVTDSVLKDFFNTKDIMVERSANDLNENDLMGIFYRNN